MNQYEMILSYLEEYGSITPMESFAALGITKLSTRIGEMRRGGLDIRAELETGTNRLGQQTRWMRYSLAKEDGLPRRCAPRNDRVRENKAGSVIIR